MFTMRGAVKADETSVKVNLPVGGWVEMPETVIGVTVDAETPKGSWLILVVQGQAALVYGSRRQGKEPFYLFAIPGWMAKLVVASHAATLEF